MPFFILTVVLTVPFFFSAMFMPLIYALLSCSAHLLQVLALKWQLLFLFSFFVAVVLVSGCIQMSFILASRLTSQPLVSRRSLSFTHFCFSHHLLSFRVVYRHHRRLLSHFVVPSSTSYSFTLASCSQGRLLIVLRVPQESY